MKDGTRMFWGFCEISEINNLSCTFISFSVICRYWKGCDFDRKETCLVHLAAVNVRYIERKNSSL